jgi:hypothetical protein
MGPGSLGVGSPLAFTGREIAGALDAATQPIMAPRYSEADPRDRHVGMSHHTRAVLDAVHAPVVVPVPAGEAAPDVGRHEVVYAEVPDLTTSLQNVGATSMGRDPAEDPKFWAYAGAAGVVAGQRTR